MTDLAGRARALGIDPDEPMPPAALLDIAHPPFPIRITEPEPTARLGDPDSGRPSDG